MSVSRGRFHSQRGATLIEMMIALLILAIGLLGFAAMQSEGLVTGRKAYLAAQAQMLAEDMAERMRANAVDITTLSSYGMSTTDVGSDKGCNSNNCSSSDIRQWDQSMWKQRLASTLPGPGNGDISVSIGTNAYATVKITVYYAADKNSTSAHDTKTVGTDALSAYVLSTQIYPN